MSKFFKIHVEKGGKPRLRMHGKASFFWHIVAMFLFLLLSALNLLRCVPHFCGKLTAVASHVLIIFLLQEYVFALIPQAK